MKKLRFGPAPFGYTWDKANKVITINNSEKNTLLFIFKSLEGGKKPKEIIRLLNEQPAKYVTRKKKQWSLTSIGYMLKAARLKFYAGLYENGHSGNWGLIITPEQSEKFIELIGAVKSVPRPRKNVFLISDLNIAYCGHCNSTEKASYVKRLKTKTTDFYYNCANKEIHGTTSCPNSKLVRQELVNNLILENVTSQRINVAKIKQYTKARENAIVLAGGKIIKDLQKETTQLIETINSSLSFSPDKIKKLNFLLSEVESQFRIKTEKFDFNKFKFGRFEGMTVQAQRVVLKNLIRTVHVFRDHLIINYYFAVTPNGNTQVSLNYEQK